MNTYCTQGRSAWLRLGSPAFSSWVVRSKPRHLRKGLGAKGVRLSWAALGGDKLWDFCTSLRAVSLWQKWWEIWDRHGWKALKELYYICQHRFSQWNLQTLTIVSNFVLFHCFKRFLSTLSELDRENSTSHLFALGIPKLKNVSLKNSLRVITTISTCPCSL